MDSGDSGDTDADGPAVPPRTSPPIHFVDDRPGDLVVFRGNVLDHGRWHPAGTSLLYVKLNAFGDNGLGDLGVSLTSGHCRHYDIGHAEASKL